MNRINTRPKKSLGQNFLVDQNVARKIVASLDLQPDDIILEIGPGHGALTQNIVPHVNRYIGVELDRNLAQKLTEEYGARDNFHLFNQDFLEFDFAQISQADEKIKIVGNIPYQITSGVIFKVIQHRSFFHQMTLMIQKEVAQRVVANSGSKAFGILAVLSQTFARPELLFSVSHHVFYPKPKVTSAMVQWDFRSDANRIVEDEAGYIQMIKNLFQTRRKMLRNNLKKCYGEEITAKSEFILDLSRRPEQLSIDEFRQLWQLIQHEGN